MSRPASGGFVLGFAAEIAVVIAAISLLPRIDLSAGHAPPAAGSAPAPAATLLETSHYQPRPVVEPVGAPAFRPPRLAYAPQPAPEPTLQREPPPLLAVDPARPAYVERRLDRASQGLVNGLGSYVSRTAENFLPPAAPTYEPRTYPPIPPAPSAASFTTQATQSGPPRPWARY